MCGIFAYAGFREAEPILIDGLTRLEYRGYDSAGLATVGWTLRWNDIALEAVEELGRLVCSPISTAQKALADVRKRFFRNSPQGRN